MYSIVRIILSIIIDLNWEVRKFDINNALLNEQIKVTIFMNQHEGYIDPAKPNHIFKLIKEIYGLM